MDHQIKETIKELQKKLESLKKSAEEIEKNLEFLKLRLFSLECYIRTDRNQLSLNMKKSGKGSSNSLNKN